MSDPLWAYRSPPPADPDAQVVGRWEPATVAELTAGRRVLAATLGDHEPAGADDGAVDGLLLAFEELGSNALRHGRPPVRLLLTAHAGSWLLEVSDAAGDTPPVPALGRDAAHGGLGLHLVARLSGAHGWTTQNGRKTAWARIQRDSARESAC